MLARADAGPDAAPPPQSSSPTPAAPAPSPSLERDLRLFHIYRFLSTSYLFTPVILIFFSARGLSVTQITLLNTVYCGTLILFEVPTGVLADRWGRKRAMVLGSLLMTAGCLLDWAGHSFIVFAVGDGLLALGMTLTSGADSAYLYDLLRDAGRQHEYRRREGSASAAKLIGTALALGAGGWLAKHDAATTYLATAVTCAVASVVAGFLREPRRWRRGVERPVVGQIVSSARAVLTHQPLLFAVLFSTLIFTLVRMSLYLYQPYLSGAGLEIANVGMVLGGLSLVAAWGAHRIDRLRRFLGERQLLWGMPALLALTYLCLGRWFVVWGVGLLLVQSLLNGVYSPLAKELLNREIADSGQRATILSVESMIKRLAFGLFAPLAGLLIDAHGLTAGLYACGALGAAGTAWLALRIFRHTLPHRLPTPTPIHIEVPVRVRKS